MLLLIICYLLIPPLHTNQYFSHVLRKKCFYSVFFLRADLVLIVFIYLTLELRCLHSDLFHMFGTDVRVFSINYAKNLAR